METASPQKHFEDMAVWKFPSFLVREGWQQLQTNLVARREIKRLLPMAIVAALFFSTCSLFLSMANNWLVTQMTSAGTVVPTSTSWRIISLGFWATSLTIQAMEIAFVVYIVRREYRATWLENEDLRTAPLTFAQRLAAILLPVVGFIVIYQTVSIVFDFIETVFYWEGFFQGNILLFNKQTPILFRCIFVRPFTGVIHGLIFLGTFGFWHLKHLGRTTRITPHSIGTMVGIFFVYNFVITGLSFLFMFVGLFEYIYSILTGLEMDAQGGHLLSVPAFRYLLLQTLFDWTTQLLFLGAGFLVMSFFWRRAMQTVRERLFRDREE